MRNAGHGHCVLGVRVVHTVADEPGVVAGVDDDAGGQLAVRDGPLDDGPEGCGKPAIREGPRCRPDDPRRVCM